MSLLMTTLVIAALMGCSVIGGVFFAFSSFIMKSLARLPSSEGIAAMQSINVVVLNRSFLGLFMGDRSDFDIVDRALAREVGQGGVAILSFRRRLVPRRDVSVDHKRQRSAE